MSAKMINNEKTVVIHAAGGLVWRHSNKKHQIILVHRPRYDDWSFPKGLLKEGEAWETAALREVREETGCEARLEEFLGCNCYLFQGQPKVVLYWMMSVVEEQVSALHKEVDRYVWLSPKKALKQLSYENEKALLRRALKNLNVG